MLFKLLFVVSIFYLTLSASISAGNEEYFVVVFDSDAFINQTEIFSTTNQRHLLHIDIANNNQHPQEINFQFFLPPTAKLVTFFIVHNDISYYGEKVSYEKAADVINQIKKEKSKAAVFVSRPVQDYSSTEKQNTENQLTIDPLNKVSFNLVYEDSNVELKDRKYVTEIRNIVDLRNTSTQDLTACIYSPNYPQSYPNSVDITWWIRGPDHHQVSLHVVDMELEECCDRLTIYDGSSHQHPVIGDLTGNRTNTNSNIFTSSSDEMYIRFISDCSLVMRGFNATITISNGSVPEYQITTVAPATTALTTAEVGDSCSSDYLYPHPYTSYDLYSPGYPLYSYPDSLTCSWRIQTSYYMYVVELEVVEMDLEMCCDSVTLFDGAHRDYPVIVMLPSKDTTTNKYYSTGLYLYIRFLSDQSVGGKGFHFRYRAIEPIVATEPPEASAGDTTTSKVTCYDDAILPVTNPNLYEHIYSPNFPEPYFPYCRLSWLIEGQLFEHIVLLDILQFSTGISDVMNVYDGSSSKDPRLLKIAGTYNPFSVKSTGPDVYIEFFSDDNYESTGFHLGYRLFSNSVLKSKSTKLQKEKTNSYTKT